jgi:hypothetical protein
MDETCMLPSVHARFAGFVIVTIRLFDIIGCFLELAWLLHSICEDYESEIQGVTGLER